MPERTSTLRLYMLRALYLFNFVLLGLDVWPAIVSEGGTWDPVRGVAFAFWGALSVLSAFGLRYPLQMLPLLLIQFLYKVIWVLAIAVPQWDGVHSLGLTKNMFIGLLIDLIVIPWPYVFRNYLKKRGDRWRPSPSRAWQPGRRVHTSLRRCASAVGAPPPSPRLHLTQAPFGVSALDCSRAVFRGQAVPVNRRGRCRTGETHNR